VRTAQCHAGEANSGTRGKTVASSIARPHTPHTSRPECGKSPVTQHHYSRLELSLDCHRVGGSTQSTKRSAPGIRPEQSFGDHQSLLRHAPKQAAEPDLAKQATVAQSMRRESTAGRSTKIQRIHSALTHTATTRDSKSPV